MRRVIDLNTAITGFYACHDTAALKRRLVDACAGFGARAISGYALPFGGALSSGQDEPLITTFPETVRRAYRGQLAGEDPVMRAALALGEPVHFLRIEKSLRASESAKAVFQAMREAGLQDGVTTPVFAKPGSYGYFVAAFGEPRLDLTPADLRCIKVVFTEFFFRFRELARASGVTLSEREREVLVAIIQDKSNAEIAESLGVTVNTVETYVRRLFAKLEVSTRTQAVLRYFGGGALEEIANSSV